MATIICSTGCQDHGWTYCCSISTSNCTIQFSAGQLCQCDQACYILGDCCSDIGQICPPPGQNFQGILHKDVL